MSFFETPRFDEAISNGAVGGPGFSSDVVVTDSGDEYRNAIWTYPLHTYDVAFGLKTQDQLDTIRALFWNTQGRVNGFRFKDWSDFQVTYAKANGVLTVINAGAHTYQLTKLYSFGSATAQRIIKKPVSGTVIIYKNAVDVTANTTIDTTTGVVTWNTSPPSGGDVVLWAGEFDVPVRFDTDKMMPTIESYNNFSWGQIPILELRNP